jgi:hypothetical protein
MNAYHFLCDGPMWPWRKDGTCQTCGVMVLFWWRSVPKAEAAGRKAGGK